jgi:hypothetical protein
VLLTPTNSGDIIVNETLGGLGTVSQAGTFAGVFNTLTNGGNIQGERWLGMACLPSATHVLTNWQYQRE